MRLNNSPLYLPQGGGNGEDWLGDCVDDFIDQAFLILFGFIGVALFYF
jgi:hypothetical protein